VSNHTNKQLHKHSYI